MERTLIYLILFFITDAIIAEAITILPLPEGWKQREWKVDATVRYGSEGGQADVAVSFDVKVRPPSDAHLVLRKERDEVMAQLLRSESCFKEFKLQDLNVECKFESVFAPMGVFPRSVTMEISRECTKCTGTERFLHAFDIRADPALLIGDEVRRCIRDEFDAFRLAKWACSRRQCMKETEGEGIETKNLVNIRGFITAISSSVSVEYMRDQYDVCKDSISVATEVDVKRALNICFVHGMCDAHVFCSLFFYNTSVYLILFNA